MENDIFIRSDSVNGAMNKDKVLVKINKASPNDGSGPRAKL